MNAQPYCWSCNQSGGEMLHWGSIHVHNTQSCRDIAGIEEEKPTIDKDALMKTIRAGLTAQIEEAAHDDNVPPLMVQMVTQSYLSLHILDTLERIEKVITMASQDEELEKWAQRNERS